MSALTDLFSAMATKIRSKTGTATTYTPAEMVSDGIDDVYDAGVAAGTPTLDGDATTGNVLSGKTFYSNSTTKQTGSMTNNGNFQGDIDPSVSNPYELSSGYYSSIELDVLPHTASSPSSSTYTSLAMGEAKSIDLGQYHKYRYVRVQAASPSGNKSITANGTNIDVSSYATASVSVSGTSITPSNSSPASMTSGTLYTPSANGYAISSYSSVTPSNSSPVSLSSGSIYKMGGAGKAVASVTNITPSSTSQSVSSGSVYKMGGNGIVLNALPTYDTKTPDNTNPPMLYNGSTYTMGGNGYAIGDYTSISQSQLNSGVYFTSGFKKMAASGYAYATEQKQSATGTFTGNTSTTTSVNCGFQPDFVCLIAFKDSTHFIVMTYEKNTSSSMYFRTARNGTSNSCTQYSLGSGLSGYSLSSIDSNGFTIGAVTSTTYGTSFRYVAMKY